MGGIGLEYGLFDTWSAKVEYNYLDFGKKTVFEGDQVCLAGGSGCSSRDIGQETHLIKLGLNYRFY
jgi:opacity protein-like surface antigen